MNRRVRDPYARWWGRGEPRGCSLSRSTGQGICRDPWASAHGSSPAKTRGCGIIGIVGAGGIGLQLSEQIRTYDFDQVAFIVLMILAAVAAIDWLSGKLRFAIIGRTQVLT